MNIETALKEAMTIDGAVGVSLSTGTAACHSAPLGGGKYLDLEVAAAGNTEVVRAKMRTMESLAPHDAIEDVLITLGKQYHLIRLLKNTATSTASSFTWCLTAASPTWRWPGTASSGSRPS